MTTSSDRQIFEILAFDQRGSYRKMLTEGTSYEQAVSIKTEIVVELAKTASAVLIDNEYGLTPAMQMPGTSGLLLSLEESGYSGDSTYRRLKFNPDWTVEKIKRMGGSAVKLLAYYHPHSGALADEIEGVIRDVVAECHRFDLPLFLEPMSYSLDAAVSKDSAAFAATRAEVVRDTAQRLSATGADILKLEFPCDAAFETDETVWRSACEAVSAACAVPWVLLSAGVDFDVFERQATIAAQTGASGWLAGRAIWKEAVIMAAGERTSFIKEKANSRIQRLVEVAEANARPWTDFYAPPTGTPDWYKV
jgi:tagatose-1,6-bisphosphate aldolase